MKSTYKVLGLMSGSSLDGIDIAFCEFKYEVTKWTFELKAAETIPYSRAWKASLKNAPHFSGEQLVDTHIQYGRLLGELAKKFVGRHKVNPDFISSHGHTIFHRPDTGFTFQLGDGQSVATNSGLQSICDFRTKDVALGGQGAPLVPIGDELLFSDYDICLNVGGIANISFKNEEKRLAYDVCAANQLLNHLSQVLGFDFDEGGLIARNGTVNSKLLNKLDNDPFFKLKYPKSLSNEYVGATFINYIDQFEDSTENKLRTATEHIAVQIAEAIKPLRAKTMLVTGGGAHNAFLRSRIHSLSDIHLDVPDKTIIDFKEALIFAFLGVLRKREEINCLRSVTGASKDSSSGVIFNP